MAVSTPVNSGYTIINGSTTGSNGSKVNTWVEYKVLSQSIANNQSTVRVVLYSQATFDSSTAHTVTRQFGYVQVGSDQQYYTMTGGYDFDNKKLNKFADHTFTVSHNADGTKTVTIKGAWSDSGWSSYITGGSASASVSLPTIPQYATANISLGSRTETSLTVNWSTDQTIDYLWYSTNGGTNYTALGSVNATSGSFTITGLTANTSYSVKIKVRNKQSQLQSESGASTFTTYSYPYANSMPSFVIGNKVTLGFFNPLGRSFTFYVILNGTQISNSWTISGTSYSGIDGSSTLTQLYNCIPNNKSATYQIKCVYSGNTVTKTGGTASVNESTNKPTIGAFTYADTNSTTSAITQNTAKIVQGLSKVTYYATGLSAKNGADISSAKVAIMGQTINLSVSGSSASGGGGTSSIVNSGTAVDARLTVTDSRGISQYVDITLDMVAYSNPSAIITLERHNNYYSETDLKADADYVTIGTNAITITYKAKKKGTSSWTVTGSLSDNVTSVITLDNTSAWDVQVAVSDSFGGSTTYNRSVQRGMPIVYFDRLRESVGINCFPAYDQSLEVNGLNLLNGLVYKGTLTSANDLDSITDTGLYYIGSSVPSNAPDMAHAYTILLVVNPVGNALKQQIYIRPSLAQGYTQMAMREQSGNPLTWLGWKYINDMSYGKGIHQISANSDLNSITETGVYFCSTSADTQSLSHSPYTEGIWVDGTTGFRLEMYSTTGSGYGLQILYTHNVHQRTYIRSLNGSTWRPWYRVITDDEIYYRNADTLSITSYTNLNGFITSSTKSVSFSFYTPKSLANISTITVTAFTGTIRGGSGYLDGQTSAYDWLADASYTLTATKMSDNMIRIVCTKTSAYTNVTNNTPVSYYGSVGLAFSTT